MQKVRIQNVWDNDSRTFDKNNFELREGEKIITGKISISSKVDGKYISKPISFIAFKGSIDNATTDALLNSKGQLFDANLNLAVGKFTNDEGKDIVFHKVIINQASFDGVSQHQKDKTNGYQTDEISNEIPF